MKTIQTNLSALRSLQTKRSADSLLVLFSGQLRGGDDFIDRSIPDIFTSFTFSCLVPQQPPPEDPFLEWLNRVCVTIGLFFFALAIVTFLLCSWNAKINNTARLHLCISLASSHFLMLWMDRYVNNKVFVHTVGEQIHRLGGYMLSS